MLEGLRQEGEHAGEERLGTRHGDTPELYLTEPHPDYPLGAQPQEPRRKQERSRGSS